MADSISRLDLLTGSTAGRDTLANELFNPMSPAALFGRRSQGCTGLTWPFTAGNDPGWNADRDPKRNGYAHQLGDQLRKPIWRQAP